MSEKEADAPEDGGAKPAPAFMGMIVQGLASLALGAAAGGLAFFLTPAPAGAPSADAAHEEAKDSEAHGPAKEAEKKKADKSAKKKDSHGAPAGGHGGGAKSGALGDVIFVPLEPLIVSLGPDASSRFLRISISLETNKDGQAVLEELTPRLRDVLNGYLRAVDEEDLAQPASMSRLRAQMLRRLQLAAPDGVITNVLITDFVLT